MNRNKITGFPVKEPANAKRSDDYEEKVLFFCLLAVLLLLCACGGNDLLAGTKNRLKIRVWDGQQTTLYWVEREENAIPAIDALKAVPVEPADDWNFDKIQPPFYSTHLPLLEGDNMEALWVNGYWIDQNGGVWYGVPALPTSRLAFPTIACWLKPGDILEQSFPVRLPYGDLPPGQYRVVFNGLTAEFEWN